MKNIIKVTKLLIILFVIAIMFGNFSNAEAYFFWKNPEWKYYKWDITPSESQFNKNPIRLGNNLTTGNWEDILDSASADWNLSVIRNKVVKGSSNPTCSIEDSVDSGNVEVCNNNYNGGWLGLTSVYATNNPDSEYAYIYAATVKMNDTYLNSGYEKYQNQVMCHEIGHIYGLDHTDENWSNENIGSCLDLTYNPAGGNGQLSNEHPSQDDYAAIEYLYPEEPNTCPTNFSMSDDYYFSQVDCWAQCGGELPDGVLTHTKFAGYYPADSDFFGQYINTWTYKDVDDDYKWHYADTDNELAGCQFTCPMGETWDGQGCIDREYVQAFSIDTNVESFSVSSDLAYNQNAYTLNPNQESDIKTIIEKREKEKKDKKDKKLKKIKNLDLNNPKNWGKAVKKDSNGKDSVFILDLGEGDYVMTHVFWANDNQFKNKKVK